MTTGEQLSWSSSSWQMFSLSLSRQVRLALRPVGNVALTTMTWLELALASLACTDYGPHNSRLHWHHQSLSTFCQRLKNLRPNSENSLRANFRKIVVKSWHFLPPKSISYDFASFLRRTRWSFHVDNDEKYPAEVQSRLHGTDDARTRFKRCLDTWINRRWRFGLVVNGVGRITEVNQRPARLLLGWVTVCRRVNHVGMQTVTQVNSAWPSLRG